VGPEPPHTPHANAPRLCCARPSSARNWCSFAKAPMAPALGRGLGSGRRRRGPARRWLWLGPAGRMVPAAGRPALLACALVGWYLVADERLSEREGSHRVKLRRCERGGCGHASRGRAGEESVLRLGGVRRERAEGLGFQVIYVGLLVGLLMGSIFRGPMKIHGCN
jgi:hypothetical protein